MIYFVYGITDCPACLRACALLMERDIEYVFVETDFSQSHRTALKKEFGWATFPMIVRAEREDEQFIGGYEDLQAALEKELTAPS